MSPEHPVASNTTSTPPPPRNGDGVATAPLGDLLSGEVKGKLEQLVNRAEIPEDIKRPPAEHSSDVPQSAEVDTDVPEGGAEGGDKNENVIIDQKEFIRKRGQRGKKREEQKIKNQNGRTENIEESRKAHALFRNLITRALNVSDTIDRESVDWKQYLLWSPIVESELKRGVRSNKFVGFPKLIERLERAVAQKNRATDPAPTQPIATPAPPSSGGTEEGEKYWRDQGMFGFGNMEGVHGKQDQDAPMQVRLQDSLPKDSIPPTDEKVIARASEQEGLQKYTDHLLPLKTAYNEAKKQLEMAQANVLDVRASMSLAQRVGKFLGTGADAYRKAQSEYEQRQVSYLDASDALFKAMGDRATERSTFREGIATEKPGIEKIKDVTNRYERIYKRALDADNQWLMKLKEAQESVPPKGALLMLMQHVTEFYRAQPRYVRYGVVPALGALAGSMLTGAAFSALLTRRLLGMTVGLSAAAGVMHVGTSMVEDKEAKRIVEANKSATFYNAKDTLQKLMDARMKAASGRAWTRRATLLTAFAAGMTTTTMLAPGGLLDPTSSLKAPESDVEPYAPPEIAHGPELEAHAFHPSGDVIPGTLKNGPAVATGVGEFDVTIGGDTKVVSASVVPPPATTGGTSVVVESGEPRALTGTYEHGSSISREIDQWLEKQKPDLPKDVRQAVVWRITDEQIKLAKADPAYAKDLGIMRNNPNLVPEGGRYTIKLPNDVELEKHIDRVAQVRTGSQPPVIEAKPSRGGTVPEPVARPSNPYAGRQVPFERPNGYGVSSANRVLESMHYKSSSPTLTTYWNSVSRLQVTNVSTLEYLTPAGSRLPDASYWNGLPGSVQQDVIKMVHELTMKYGTEVFYENGKPLPLGLVLERLDARYMNESQHIVAPTGVQETNPSPPSTVRTEVSQPTPPVLNETTTPPNLAEEEVVPEQPVRTPEQRAYIPRTGENALGFRYQYPLDAALSRRIFTEIGYGRMTSEGWLRMRNLPIEELRVTTPGYIPTSWESYGIARADIEHMRVMLQDFGREYLRAGLQKQLPEGGGMNVVEYMRRLAKGMEGMRR